MTRLPLDDADVARVVAATRFVRSTVLAYRRGRRMHLSTETAITRAIRELPTSPQLALPVVDTPVDKPPATPRDESGNGGQFGAVTGRINPGGESPTMGQPGDARSCPPGLGDCETPAPRCTSKSRCHVTVIGPDGKVTVDEVAL